MPFKLQIPPSPPPTPDGLEKSFRERGSSPAQPQRGVRSKETNNPLVGGNHHSDHVAPASGGKGTVFWDPRFQQCSEIPTLFYLEDPNEDESYEAYASEFDYQFDGRSTTSTSPREYLYNDGLRITRMERSELGLDTIGGSGRSDEGLDSWPCSNTYKSSEDSPISPSYQHAEGFVENPKLSFKHWLFYHIFQRFVYAIKSRLQKWGYIVGPGSELKLVYTLLDLFLGLLLAVAEKIYGSRLHCQPRQQPEQQTREEPVAIFDHSQEFRLASSVKSGFPKFSKLPPEIRVRILEIAALAWGPNTVYMYCRPRTVEAEKAKQLFRSYDRSVQAIDDSNKVILREIPNDWPWELRAHYKFPPLLQANFESRQAAKKYYIRCFGYQLSNACGVWFDFAQDTLVMLSGAAFDLFKHGVKNNTQDRAELRKIEKDLRFLGLKDLTPSDVVGLCDYAGGLRNLQKLYLQSNFYAPYRTFEEYFFNRINLELMNSWNQALAARQIAQIPVVHAFDTGEFDQVLGIGDYEVAGDAAVNEMQLPTSFDMSKYRMEAKERRLSSLRMMKGLRNTFTTYQYTEGDPGGLDLGLQAPAA